MSGFDAVTTDESPGVTANDPNASLKRIRAARLTLPPVVMLAVALWGISGASFWRDEAATLSAVRRPLPELWHFLGTTDVVHGSYYLLMYSVARLFGTTELDMRFPSAIAVTLTAAGIAAIASRLVSERAGLAAGLMFAALPVASRYGQEARSYAFIMGFAVLSSYLLCRAITSDKAVKNWWIAYTAALAIMGWANLMSFLIIPAHALTVNAAIRKKFLPGQSVFPSPSQPQSWLGAIIDSCKIAISWLAAVIAAGLAVIPLVIFAWPQRDGTTRFLAVTSVSSVADMPGRLTGSWEVLPVAFLLVVMAFRGDIRRASVGWLCLPWLIIPPIVLLAAGAFSPLYDPRYILFCVPALAILAGVGMDVLIGGITAKYKIRRGNQKRSISSTSFFLCKAKSSPALGVIAGVILVGTIGVPSQLAYRAPDGHGDNIRLAAQIVARYERRNDAVLYQPPWWRQIAAAYPFGFNHLRDISLAKTPDQAGNFTGIQLPVSQIRKRLRTTQRVWLVEFMTFHPDPVLATGWKMVAHWHPSTFVLVLYQRQAFTPAAHQHLKLLRNRPDWRPGQAYIRRSGHAST